jgi:hypothetical protein
VLGKTGSGKTQASLWHLSQHDLMATPWLLLDFKKEPMIGRIPGIVTVDMEAEQLPEDAGLMRVSPQPGQEEEVTALLWQVWERENMGVFLDEAYMVSARNDALNALITQGRSKHIPMIICSQRPAWVSRFVLSEAEFIQVFQLNDARDRDTVKGFLPASVDIERRLPDYCSYYYDVGADDVLVLRPVPEETVIMDALAEQLLEEIPEETKRDTLRFI